MYKFKNTEINNDKASEFETKSLLYLLGMRKDSKEIEYITIDCFNDVTGLNNDCSKLWDVQSKNYKSLPPNQIGLSLYTLYDNYTSLVSFEDYILFIPKLNRDYLIDTTLNCYKYNNINEKTKKGIEKKLINEILRVNPTYSSPPPLFQSFLDNITFVEDNKKISTYIKQITNFKNKKDFSDSLYESIFNEIRAIQTNLKNTYIENKTISSTEEVLLLNRHVTKNQINTLLISRFIGIDIFAYKSIPITFLDLVREKDIEDVKDLMQECQSNLSRTFFNKNETKNFWNVSEQLIKLVKNNNKKKISLK